MAQDPVSAPASASPPVGQPVIGSRLLTIEHRAWQVLGASLGPTRSTVLRLTVTLGVDCVVERVDGQPLGNLAEQFREQIAAARADLEERLRRGGTNNWRRESGTTPVPSAARVEVPTADAKKQQTTSSVFRCERQVITDRITRLRHETPLPLPPPSPAEAAEARLAELQRSRERLAEIRAQYWEEHGEHQADNLLPSPAVPEPEAEAKPPHTTSVFRVDREIITDRIERLKRKAEAPPPQQPPESDPGLIVWPEDRK